MTTRERSDADTAAESEAQPERFDGTFCPGVCFASGHCFRLFDW